VKERSELRNRAEFAAFRAVRGLAGTLGPEPLARVGAALGRAFLAVGARRRAILQFNLRLAFPERTPAERRELAIAVARHFGRVALDTLRLQRVEPEDFLDGVEVTGEEHIDQAASLDRGLLFLTAHLGLWEVCALAVGLLRPETLLAVNRPLDNPLLEEEVVRFRSRFGNVPLGKRNIARAILQHLKARGSVGFLIDQKVSPSVGVEVPFFGQPAWTHPILARIVRKTRTPVVPVCALWEAPGRYSLTFTEPVLADELTEPELEDVPLTARFSAISEAMIRRRPEQWLWYHDRWRHLRLESSKLKVESPQPPRSGSFPAPR
jgi:KDO2-lipid IV(A) lauroyltransferase